MAASLFHPVIAGWFEEKFSQPSEVQLQGWPAIASGQDVLLTAPTGSGKTLTAFLIAIDRLFRQALTGHLPERIEVVYISPLKALANDIQKTWNSRWPKSISRLSRPAICWRKSAPWCAAAIPGRRSARPTCAILHRSWSPLRNRSIWL